MTTPEQPPRLLAPDGEASPLVSSLLQSASIDEPTEAELVDLDSRVAPLATAPMAKGWAPAGPLTGGVLVAVVAAVLWWQLGRTAVAPTTRLVPPTAPENAWVAEAPAVEPPTVVERPAPKPAPPKKIEIVRPKVNVVPVPLPATAKIETPAPSPADELALLERAQRTLQSGDRQTALALAAQHSREFPEGIFEQERELIAIEALMKTGQAAAAKARAAQFVAKFPGSVHLARVRGLVTHDGG